MNFMLGKLTFLFSISYSLIETRVCVRVCTKVNINNSVRQDILESGELVSNESTEN